MTNFPDLPKVNKMTYSESESDFSFAINSVWDVDPTSESGSESNLNLNLILVQIFVVFSPYIYTLLNKFADGFFYPFS